LGLITEVIKLKWNHSNKKWFQSKGYLLTNINEEFEINVSSLKTGSHTHVEVQCDNKDCKKIISTEWRTYLKF